MDGMECRSTTSSIPGLGLVANQIDHVVDNALDLEIGRFQVQLAGLDLRHVENVVDDAEQMVRRVADLVEALAVLRLADVALEQVGHAEDGVHRRADLVAHVGQELALRPVGCLGFLAGCLGLPRAAAHHFLQVFAMLGQFGLDTLAFGNVLEGQHATNHLPLFDLRRGLVIDREAAAVTAPEQVIADLVGLLAEQGLLDRAIAAG
jgi:hypothetical protein